MTTTGILRTLILKSGLANFPVKGRKGLLEGMRWSLFPWTSYWKGTHEPSIQACIRNQPLEPGDCCWDLGAHFGFYSIYLASRVGPSGQVVAVEPNFTSYRKILLHQRLNKLSNLIVKNCGASEETGQLTLLRYDDANTTTTHFAYTGEDVSKVPHQESVPVIALDDLVSSQEIRPPKFIKIDVEGHGHKAIAGFAATLRDHRPTILFATHCPEEISAANNLIRDVGYSVQTIGGVSLESIDTCDDFLLTPN